MPTLHDLMSASIDARAAALGGADASPAGVTRGLIARRRRRNAAVAGGTSALAIGGLVAAGLLQGSRGQAPASADPNAIEYVKVDMGGRSGLQGFTDPVTYLSCGDSVAAPVTEDQNFAQSVAVDPSTSGENLRVSASLQYNGPDRAPAYIDPGQAVLARDGVVVNHLGNGDTGVPFDPLTTGDTWHANSMLYGGIFTFGPCQNGTDTPRRSPDEVAYQAGEYQIYVLSHALVTAPMIAEKELADRGYDVTSITQSALNPRSIDCRRILAQTPGGSVPVQCLDSLPSGVTLDVEAGTATLPYHSANYSGELNVTLVSQPITVALDHDITFGDLGYVSGPTSEPISDKPLTCGQVDGPLFFASDLDTTFAQPVTLADLLSGTEEPILVDARTRDERTRGTLHLADGAIASVVLGDSSSGALVAAQGSVALTPSVVSIDRAKGYPDVSLKLDGMTECPAPTEGPWTVRKLDSPTLGVWLVIQGDLRIDWEDGTTTTANSLTLNGRQEG